MTAASTLALRRKLNRRRQILLVADAVAVPRPMSARCRCVHTTPRRIRAAGSKPISNPERRMRIDHGAVALLHTPTAARKVATCRALPRRGRAGSAYAPGDTGALVRGADAVQRKRELHGAGAARR